MTTPTRPTLDALVTAMTGKDSTNQWDVVVSYALEQLNQFLATQYDAGKLARRVQLRTTYKDDFDGDTKTVDYDLRLASPTLAFNSQAQGSAILTMAIAKDSAYTVTPTSGPPATTAFPDGRYSVQCVVPLATLSGSSGAIQPATSVITFDDGKEDEQHVILDFKKTVDTDYQIVPAPDPGGSDLEALYLPLLANYFRGDGVSAIDYALTSVNNKAAGTGLVLKPKQFVLATSGTLGTGTLSLYIVTDASGRDPGKPTPVFQPDGSPLVPVPAGYAASIILSYDLITNVYFRSQLETKDASGKQRYTVKVVSTAQSGVDKGGVDLRLITNESVIADGKSGSYIGGGYSYDGLNIPIDDKNPMSLTIVDAKYTLSWSGSTTSEWSESTSGVNTSGSYRYGDIKFTITLSKGPTAFPPLAGDELKLIDLQLTSGDFKVDKDTGKCSAESALGKSTSAPPYYDNMKLSVPQIDLRLAGLNFFLETNLLSPGQEVVEVDRTVGVKTPHDFLLVGSFKTKPSP